jgi:hypothetical protein
MAQALVLALGGTLAAVLNRLSGDALHDWIPWFTRCLLDGKLLAWIRKADPGSTIFCFAAESPAFLPSIYSISTETIVAGTRLRNGSSG